MNVKKFLLKNKYKFLWFNIFIFIYLLYHSRLSSSYISEVHKVKLSLINYIIVVESLY